MAKENNSLLIFDFDNTITNGHMHNAFSGKHSGFKKSDFNSGAEYAVTDTDIENFLKNTSGIKNEEGLKSVLQSALSSGMEVNIASYTGYPDAVKRVAENHLGLSKERAKNISVFGGFPADYDTQLPRQDIREQQSQVGKNLHICRAIVKYKNNHNGQLPKTVMLVDDSTDNIKKIDEFVESMSKREGWLKENGLSIEEIQKIKFEGVQAPMSKNGEVVGDADYLGKVQKFINTSLIQEPIYANLRKEDPIYQNLQDIHGSSSEKELSPPLPRKKRKLDSDIAVDSENKKQDIKPSETQAKPTRSRRHAMILDPAQIGSVHQNTEELSPGKKYAHTKTFSLTEQIKAIGIVFEKYGQKVINAICSLFKKEVITTIEKRDYRVNVEQGKDGIVINGSKPINVPEINKDIADSLTKVTMENQEKIQDLEKRHKGNQLGREISKLLNADLQKENINSNSVGKNYNDGEPTHQTVQEARNYHQQKRGINPNSMSKKPLAPPLPPKSCMEEVRAEGKTKTIEKS